MSRDWKLCVWGLTAGWAGVAAADGHFLLSLFFFGCCIAMRLWAGDPPRGDTA